MERRSGGGVGLGWIGLDRRGTELDARAWRERESGKDGWTEVGRQLNRGLSKGEEGGRGLAALLSCLV